MEYSPSTCRSDNVRRCSAPDRRSMSDSLSINKWINEKGHLIHYINLGLDNLVSFNYTNMCSRSNARGPLWTRLTWKETCCKFQREKAFGSSFCQLYSLYWDIPYVFIMTYCIVYVVTYGSITYVITYSVYSLAVCIMFLYHDMRTYVSCFVEIYISKNKSIYIYIYMHIVTMCLYCDV